MGGLACEVRGTLVAVGAQIGKEMLEKDADARAGVVQDGCGNARLARDGAEELTTREMEEIATPVGEPRENELWQLRGGSRPASASR